MKRRKTDALQESPLANTDQQFYGLASTAPRSIPSRRGTCPGCGRTASSKRDRLCAACTEAGIQAPPCSKRAAD